MNTTANYHADTLATTPMAAARGVNWRIQDLAEMLQMQAAILELEKALAEAADKQASTN